MKVVRCKSEEKHKEIEDFYQNLCRDPRTEEELKLEKSTLASSRRVMKMMLDQKADMMRHMLDFKRLAREIQESIKATE